MMNPLVNEVKTGYEDNGLISGRTIANILYDYCWNIPQPHSQLLVIQHECTY